MPDLGGDSPGEVSLPYHETANLEGGCFACVPSGVGAAGPWAGQEGVTVWTLAQG